jgi:hypothetical protein
MKVSDGNFEVTGCPLGSSEFV